MDQLVKSSFTSVRKTVNHIWDAELMWMARMNGETLSWPPTAAFASPAIGDFVRTSNDFANYVEGKDEEFLSSECTYHTSKGEKFTTPVSGIIMHCMNHSTYHRGQIITMIRGLEAASELPALDLVVYLRTLKS